MRIHISVFILVCASYGNQEAQSQFSSGLSDSLFGPDPLLYNGSIYDYLPPYGTAGTHYLFEFPDSSASVVIRGKLYTGLIINYDIFNQAVVMTYTRPDGGVTLVSLSKAWLEQFQVHGRIFRLDTAQDHIARRIFEISGNGALSVYTFWSCDIALKSSAGTTNWAFSTAKAQQYLHHQQGSCAFGTRRSFLKCFPAQARNDLRSFMKREEMRMRSISAAEWEKLLQFAEHKLML